MKFIGREKELGALQEKYESDDFQMAVVFGRRRVGKTTLLNRFIDTNDCRAISFVATEQKEPALLKMMSASVMEALSPELADTVSFENFEKLFDFITKFAIERRVVFLIDEYPYLAQECPYMNSLLQKYVDTKWKNTKLFLILCGSLVSFMSDEVLGKDAPLHGRSSLELKVRPFDYTVSGEFVPDYTPEEKAVVYGLTNGVAKYLEQFDPKLDLETNIKKQFFSNTGYFSAEQIKTIITGDKLHPVAYNTILSAIADGRTKYSELSDVTKIDNLTYYLKMLIENEIVEKRFSGKRPYYLISDSMLSFWFNYVNRGLSLINADRGDVYYEKNVRSHLHEYMGKVFEEMTKQYIFSHIGTEKIPQIVTDISDFQTNIKLENEIKSIEVDLLCRNQSQTVLVGECKFKTESFDKADLENFLEKLTYVPGAFDAKIILFSLNGFTRYVIENAKDAILIDIKGMYNNS